MGKQNFAYLYARVHTPPQVSFDKETGEYHHGMFYADVVRGPRAVGDNLHFVKHDKPLIMSKEKQVLDLYMTGMSYSQIARVLGRYEKSTDNALQRLKSKIRKIL